MRQKVVSKIEVDTGYIISWLLLSHLLVVSAILLVLLVSVVVLVGVALLLGAGQAINEVVSGLVSDVAEETVHQVLVPLQLVLDGLTEEKTHMN